ncbi:MAG: hypothetical protein AB7K09_12190 [Planctomycetota bacterium]
MSTNMHKAPKPLSNLAIRLLAVGIVVGGMILHSLFCANLPGPRRPAWMPGPAPAPANEPAKAPDIATPVAPQQPDTHDR